MLLLSGSLFMLYYNSGRFKNSYAELDNEIDRLNNSRITYNEKALRLDSGTWHLNKWEMYHTLYFENGNTVSIDNHIDTLLRYSYKLKDDTLWLFVTEKNSVPNKIKLHSSQELVFESLLDKKKELRYSRENNLKK